MMIEFGKVLISTYIEFNEQNQKANKSKEKRFSSKCSQIRNDIINTYRALGIGYRVTVVSGRRKDSNENNNKIHFDFP